MALVKYNNNSLSAITAASSLPTGAMTLIKEITASSDGTIDFVDGTSDVVLDSTYPIYLFKFINAHASNDDVVFQFQGNASGGSGFNETITSAGFDTYHKEDDSSATLRYLTGGDQAQGTSYQTLSTSETENDASLSGYLYLFNPSSTTFVKNFMSRTQDTHGSTSADSYYAGYFNTTSAIDEISFKFASGNIDAGTFKLYGIKDS